MFTPNTNQRLSLIKALFYVLISTVGFSGSAYLVLWYYSHIRQVRMQNEAYNIKAIVQTGPEKEALKTIYLAEQLGLSVDHPTNLYAFNAATAEKKLLSNPVIKAASVKKVFPDTVYIDYTIRKPVAFLADFTNTAMDEEGILFPFQPFFTPKNFPEIFIGLSPDLATGTIWGRPLKGEKIQLAMDVLKHLQQCCPVSSTIKKIDVSRIDAASDGQRQIVVLMEDRQEREKEGKSVLYIYPRLLRLPAADYQAGLREFVVLRDYLLQKEAQKELDASQKVVKAPVTFIDLRIPQLAFVKGE